VYAVTGDLNEDGVVDFNDFFIFSDNFGKEGPPILPDTIVVAITDTVVQVVRDTTVVIIEDILAVTIVDTLYVARIDSTNLAYRMNFAYLKGRDDATDAALRSLLPLNERTWRDLWVIYNFTQPEVAAVLASANSLQPPAEMEQTHQMWLEELRAASIFHTEQWQQVRQNVSGSSMDPRWEAVIDAARQLVVDSAKQPQTCFCSKGFIPTGCEAFCASLLGD